MDLWQLKVFVSVVEKKSFSKAAEALNLSQPTVSSHIRELEEYFRYPLLDRLGRITEPTKAGAILFRYSKELLRVREKARSAVFDFLGTTKGNLLVGGSTIPSEYILPQIIGLFLKKFPEVSVSLSSGDTMQIINAIKEGKTETGIVGAGIKDPQIRQDRLVPDVLKLIVPPDHEWAERKSIHCSELFGEVFIARAKGSGTWQSVLRSMEKAGFNPKALKISVTMGSTISVIQGILNNVGISILSAVAVQDDIRRGRLKALSVRGLDLKRYFYLTVSEKRALSPVCRRFTEFAKQTFPCSDSEKKLD